MEKIVSVQKDRPMFTRSMSTSGDHSNKNREKEVEEKKIEEGLALLMKRELGGSRILVCWTCKELGHYSYKCPKREKKYKYKKP